MSGTELLPGEEWKRRPDAVREGARWGVIVFFACLTFALLALLTAVVVGFAVRLAIGGHPSLRL